MGIGIEKIAFSGNGILLPQTIEPHPKLNIICGGNGSGKTTFLRYIVANFHKSHSIHSLLSSVQHFKSFPQMIKYTNASSSLRPPQAKQFANEYKIIPRLMDNPSLIDECNKFLTSLGIPTQLHMANTEGGWLVFRNPRHISKYAISLEEISPGERTAFILWLLTKSPTKPDVLILDEFDAHLSFAGGILQEGENIPIIKMLYEHLIKHFVNNGTQIFIATNRDIPDLSRHRDVYKQFVIENGKIEKYAKD